MPRTLRLTVAVVALMLGLSACGGSSKSSSTTSSTPAATSATSTAAATGTTSTSASTSSAAAGASSTLTDSADPSGALKFTKSTLTAKAGTVTIDFTNSSPLAHNFTVQQGTSGPVVGATPTFMGGTKTLTLKLKAGTYTFYCSVPGHRAAGMQGTLTVQ
ncbi:MAG: plastocyanin/azurin family copper-binding protein [Solirubrobacteraceae bacterium]